jgi:hypothetical protein
MKKITTLIFLSGIISFSAAQQIPNLPIPLGAGNAEVWNGSIYHFGGSNNWAGSIVYPRIYRFDGTTWAYHDTIPDYNLWDVETLLVGDNVYLLSGWPSGPSLNRRYNMNTGQWTYLSPSPNTSQTWGMTSEELNGIIYLFDSYGNVHAYNIATDTWSTRTPNTASGSWDMSSILFQGEIYILGWSNSAFYKYTPATDQWTQLADSPYQVGACAFGIINDLIYAIGGNAGGGSAAYYSSIIVYNITGNSWATSGIALSSARHWMATAEYLGGLYVVGGINENSLSVDIVEEIVPQGTAGIGDNSGIEQGYFLEQNTPNPFRSSTTISYTLPSPSPVTLKLHNLLGSEVKTIFDGNKPAGNHRVSFDAIGLKSGVYYYSLQTGKYIQTKKMMIK